MEPASAHESNSSSLVPSGHATAASLVRVGIGVRVRVRFRVRVRDGRQPG